MLLHTLLMVSFVQIRKKLIRVGGLGLGGDVDPTQNVQSSKGK